jgi:very-short-patch-repair endonuclease
VQVGKYVIDFLIGKIVLEADGDYWHSRTKARDNRRDAYFQSLGYDVVRISEKEIKTSPDLDMLILARLSSINTANNYAIPGI